VFSSNHSPRLLRYATHGSGCGERHTSLPLRQSRQSSTQRSFSRAVRSDKVCRVGDRSVGGAFTLTEEALEFSDDRLGIKLPSQPPLLYLSFLVRGDDEGWYGLSRSARMLGSSRDENDVSCSSKDFNLEVTGRTGQSPLGFMTAMNWKTRFGLYPMCDAVVNWSIVLVRHFTSLLRTAFCW
jgi:hypothetical protein